MKKIGLLLLCVLLLGGLIFGALQMTKKEAEIPIENAGLAQNAALEPESLTYNGEDYPLRPHLQTAQKPTRSRPGAARPFTTTIKRISLWLLSWTLTRARRKFSS